MLFRRDPPLIPHRAVWVPPTVAVNAITLSTDGTLTYKPSAAAIDNKLYLTTDGTIAAKTAPGAGDRRISLSGGNWLAN
jgi:hypothetical protein